MIDLTPNLGVLEFRDLHVNSFVRTFGQGVDQVEHLLRLRFVEAAFVILVMTLKLFVDKLVPHLGVNHDCRLDVSLVVAVKDGQKKVK